jgi:hypothetical protein
MVENELLKEKISQGILSLLVQLEVSDIKPKPHEFFTPILLQKTLEIALQHQERAETYFKLICELLNNLDITSSAIDVDETLGQLVSFVKQRKPVEITQKDNDIVLNGILQVLRRLFYRYPAKSRKYGQEEKLVHELLQACLFEIPRRPDRKIIPGPKCKNHTTRQSALSLLIELSRNSYDNLKDIINFITPIHKHANWRTKRYNDWYIAPKEDEKSSTGYVGLKNLGCSTLSTFIFTL